MFLEIRLNECNNVNAPPIIIPARLIVFCKNVMIISLYLFSIGWKNNWNNESEITITNIKKIAFEMINVAGVIAGNNTNIPSNELNMTKYINLNEPKLMINLETKITSKINDENDVIKKNEPKKAERSLSF